MLVVDVYEFLLMKLLQFSLQALHALSEYGSHIRLYITAETVNEFHFHEFCHSFDEFLMDLKQSKRKNIRQERKKV